METLVASSGAHSSGQQPSTSTTRSTTVSTIPPLLRPPARGILAARSEPDKPNETLQLHAASSLSKPANGSQSFESLPHLAPSSTKAGRYSKLMEFDQHVLKRPRAHCRNALRSTEQLQTILGQLNKDLKKLHTSDELQFELEKLSVYSKAFEEVIPLTGPYASLLGKVKDMYDGRVKDALARYREVSQPGGRRKSRKHQSKERGRDEGEEGEGKKGEGLTEWLDLRAAPLPGGGRHWEKEYGSQSYGQSGRDGHRPESRGRELYQLRRELHQLEVKCRVLLEESHRLGAEFEEEEQNYRTAMETLLAPLPELEEVVPQHSSEVERLQMEIAVTLEQLEVVRARRRGRVPVQVCRQVEQTVREMENEQHKLRKQNELLKQQVEGAKSELQTILDQHHTSRSSAEALWTALGQKVT